MNKYEQALEFFKKVSNRIPLKFANDEFCKQYDENLMLIKEMVEKATPKKINVKVRDNVERAYCPNCHLFLTWYSGAHCYHCGQRLDWSEEE